MQSHDIRKRRLVTRSLAVAGVMLVVAASAGGWLAYRRGEFDRNLTAVWKAGYRERDAAVDGARIHYAEGPANGLPPLLLIHGQSTDWKSYAAVLPALSRDYHVYAVDAFGHGGSEHDPALYSALAHGQRLARFIENVIGEPVVVSGHSSGGVLSAWLAGNAQP
ncbi:alpha/beta fold hydrolase [Naumannella sp. ID2617S]|nr:alpha/beta fold hydrolase [Naumannella sp. ID2617S]